jgi:site-specific DNA-methyltransferase (adenine-specific)
MEREAVTAGFYHSPGWNQDYPRIQILTVEDLLQGACVRMPLQWGTFRQAERVQDSGAVQGKLDI